MHAHELAAHAIAARLVAICRAGFTNHFHWMAWRKKHAQEIEALPLDLRNRVTMAWDAAPSKEHSR